MVSCQEVARDLQARPADLSQDTGASYASPGVSVWWVTTLKAPTACPCIIESHHSTHNTINSAGFVYSKEELKVYTYDSFNTSKRALITSK
eukprot:c31276_g1_i1 orf=458-730(-)